MSSTTVRIQLPAGMSDVTINVPVTVPSMALAEILRGDPDVHAVCEAASGMRFMEAADRLRGRQDPAAKAARAYLFGIVDGQRMAR